MDSFSILHLSSRGGNIERTQLRYSFQTLTLRQAAALAAELKTMAACTPHVHAAPAPAPASERRHWIVTATTPPIPLTLTVLRRWEDELLAIEQRWSGSRFLGWRTSATPAARPGLQGRSCKEGGASGASSRGGGESADGNDHLSQRQLVIASLLRHSYSAHEGGGFRRAAQS